MTFGNNVFAFSACDNSELKCINSDNPVVNIVNSDNSINETTYPKLHDKDIDKNLRNVNNCKYYTVNEFQLSNDMGNFNILHNNLNGLESKLDIFHQFLAGSSSKFDVIAITETSQKIINEDFKTNISMEGYLNFSTPSNSNKGGTAIYVKNTFDVIERLDLNVTHDQFESVWIEIKNKKSKNIICGSIYRHPHDNLQKFDNFLEYMEMTLNKISNEQKDTYICGDFNSDLLKLDRVSNYKKFYEQMCSYGLLPQIIQPTRTTDNSATIVDNIFTNNMNNNKISGNIITDFSDHYTQFVSVFREKIDYKSINIYKRDFSIFSEESFRDDVSIQNFNNQFQDINDKFNDFYSKLEACVERHAPLKKLSPKQVKLENKPWVTADIQKMIRIRNKLFQRKKRQPNNEENRRLYNLFRNRVNNELKKSKKNHYVKFFEDNNNNIKKTWEGIRSIININKSKLPSVSQIKVKDKIISNPKKVADTLNNFFVNVGPNTENNIPSNPKIKPEKYLKNKNRLNFIIAHISNEEVLDIINNLENKSTGPQSIPVKLLKLIPDLILIPLCEIINQSFQTGKYPDALKICKVIPIHKGGATDDLNNYRPISLLSIFDKIMEKLMHKRLYDFLQEHKILFPNQFGFRKNNSTTYALLQITEKIKETIDKGKHGCGIFIDLRKAFDTVNHEILIRKLEHYGIRGSALHWFESYLTNRKQYVYINGESSQMDNITCGVPQGSVLGPLLFLIYINDLPNISSVLQFYLFADDTNIYYEADSLNKLERVINNELKKLYTWLIVNRLSLNIDKTNFLVFHPYNKPMKQLITIKINKKAISEKDHIKYLGVILDATITWKTHIDKICKTVSRTIGVMYKIRPYVNLKILKTIYYSLIYSHLIYAIEVWGSADNTHLNHILVLQKRVVRMIYYLDKRQPDYSFPSADPLFHELDLLKVHDIFKLKVAKFIYNCLNKFSPTNFHSWFELTSQTHRYNTRSKFIDIDNLLTTNNLFIPTCRTTHYGLKSVKVQGPKIWNIIPPIIRSNTSAKCFSKELKKYLTTLS